MAGHHFAATQFHRPSFESLSSEYPTVGAVVGLTNGLDDLVHSPAIEFLIREYFERKLLFLLVALDSLQRIIAVALDALINGEHVELDPVVVLVVEFVENMDQHR